MCASTLVEGSASTCVPLRHHGLPPAPWCVAGCHAPSPCHPNVQSSVDHRRQAACAACEPSEHEPEGVSFSHIWYAGTYHYAQACDCRVRICMCPGSDEPRVQQGNCSEPRSPSIFPNLRLGSRTTFVPIRPKTEAPRRAAELSQLSASAWLRAADRALRDEKKCFPLKDELLALGWASSRGNLAEGRRNTGSLAAAAQRTHGCARYNGPHWLRTG